MLQSLEESIEKRRDDVNKYPQKGGMKSAAFPERRKWVVTGKRYSVDGRGKLPCQYRMGSD